MPVQPDTLNHRLNTPTKLYDAIGAGVPVVASDLPGIAPIVTETGCGELCDPFDPLDIARAIRAILDAPARERDGYRVRCLAAARGTYSWERQADALMDVYARYRRASTVVGLPGRQHEGALPAGLHRANAYQRLLADALRARGVTVTADATGRRRLLPMLGAVRRQGRPDVVHIHWTEPYISGRRRDVSRARAMRTVTELRLLRRAGIGIVWTAHDLSRHDREVDPLEVDFNRALFRLSGAVIVHCEAARDGLIDALAVSSDRGRQGHGHPARQLRRRVPR